MFQSIGFYRILSDSIGFYRILSDSIGFIEPERFVSREKVSLVLSIRRRRQFGICEKETTKQVRLASLPFVTCARQPKYAWRKSEMVWSFRYVDNAAKNKMDVENIEGEKSTSENKISMKIRGKYLDRPRNLESSWTTHIEVLISKSNQDWCPRGNRCWIV